MVGFILVVPDFVIELRSATDNLKPTQEKMREYQRVGVKLGLLVNPKNKQGLSPAQVVEVVLKAIKPISSRPFSFAVTFAKRSEGKVIAKDASELEHTNY
jgi:hypothetical protein